MDQRHRIIVTDANVLINLFKAGLLLLPSRLPGYEFIIPEHVQAEITYPDQREALNRAISEGTYKVQKLTEPSDIFELVRLTKFLGRGESACLVLAQRHRWMVASDEKGRFRRMAGESIGLERLVTTEGILIFAVRAGAISEAQLMLAREIIGT